MKPPQSTNFTDLNLEHHSDVQQAAYIKSFSQRTGEQARQLVTDFLAGILHLVLEDRSRSSVRFLTDLPSSELSLAVPPKSEILLTAYEIAVILNISKAKAYKLISGGEISSIRFGRTTRVRAQDLEKFVNDHLIQTT
jgi:excisionase family DNA binding protein